MTPRNSSNADSLPACSTAWRTHLTDLLVVSLMLGASAAASYTAAQTNAATWDEPLYLSAGTSYWRENDYRLIPESGNWPQRIAGALPAAMAAFPVDDPTQTEGYKQWRRANSIRLGKILCYEWNDADAILARSRAALLLVSTALGATIYFWSRRLWGRLGGLVSLALFAASPPMLAHGTIAQSDMCVTLFSLLALGATWQMLLRPSIARAVVAGMVLAGAMLSKHSALLLLPTFALLLCLRTWHAYRKPATSGEPACRTRRSCRTFGRSIALLLLQGAVGIGVIWASFGFRYSAFPPHATDGAFQSTWDYALQRRDTVTGVVQVCREQRLLPEAFLFGVAFMHQRNSYRPGFLGGTYYESGTAWYLPACWLLKTPPGHVAIVGFAAIAFAAFAFRNRRRRTARALYRTAPLWIFALLFAGVAVVSRFNTGDRYFFPIYAPLMILIGGVARWAKPRVGPTTHGTRRTFRIALFAALGSAALEAALTWPGYLSYVTPVVGGPTEGWRYLCDSSFDWGQDLSRLAPRIEELQAESATPQKVYLGYFGTASPEYHGVKAAPLPRGARLEMPDKLPPLEPGIYCLSVTELHRLYGSICGPWTQDRERAYQGLRQIEAALAKATGKQRDALLDHYPRIALGYLERDLAELEYAKLCRYLTARKPDARAGDTIFLYVLSSQELRSALDRPL